MTDMELVTRVEVQAQPSLLSCTDSTCMNLTVTARKR
jgi:hypothetical protein